MKIKAFFNKIFSKYLLLHLTAMAVFIVAMLFGVIFWLNSYTHHGEGVHVPDLMGVDYAQAVALLDKAGLRAIVADSGYNKTMPANCVLTQAPGPGTNVKKGREVVVTINATHAKVIKFPDIIDNCSFREAKARLVSMGFQMLDPMLVDGERDWVYGAVCDGKEVHAGDRIPIDATLMLVVGRGLVEEDQEDMMLDVPETGMGEVDDFEEIP